jgi:hypothetical protein
MNAVPKNPYKGREAVMFDFAVSAHDSGECFFYIRIPGHIGPDERVEWFEDPLEAFLGATRIGRLTGGGSQLGEGKTIAFCGVDVVVADRATGLSALKQELQRLHAPAGTIIEEYLPQRLDHPVYQ